MIDAEHGSTVDPHGNETLPLDEHPYDTDARKRLRALASVARTYREAKEAGLELDSLPTLWRICEAKATAHAKRPLTETEQGVIFGACSRVLEGNKLAQIANYRTLSMEVAPEAA